MYFYYDFYRCFLMGVWVPRPSALILIPSAARPQKYYKNKFKNKAYYLFKITLIQD